MTTHPASSLKLYTATAEEDLLIGQWYLRMAADGDLERTFTKDSRTLGALFGIVRPPKTLVYLRDAEGIWFAMWGEQLLNGAFTGLWVRQTRRRTREAVWAALDAMAWYLTPFPVLFGVTKQPNLLAIHRKLGYDVIDRVEGWFDGEDAWIVKLTRERLHAARARLRATKRRGWVWPTSMADAGTVPTAAHTAPWVPYTETEVD